MNSKQRSPRGDTTSHPIPSPTNLTSIFKASFAIVGALVSLFGFNYYVDYRIERLTQNPEFLRKLSDTVRPSCIFNNKGSVLVDRGAMSHLDGIDVLQPIKSSEAPPKIVVHPKRPFARAPLLWTTSPVVMQVLSVERGTKFDWVYSLNYLVPGAGEAPIQYQLELLD